MTQWAEQSRTRQGLYRFTGAALQPPDEEHFSVLLPSLDVLDSHDIDQFAFGREWRRFGDEFRLGPDPAALAIEYVRLFGVGMQGTPAMPTESYYRVPGRDGGIADFVAALLKDYRSMGLVLSDTSQAPDHITTELHVMSYLCSIEADNWEAERTELAMEALHSQAAFLKRHLAVWVPPFAANARTAGAKGFYGHLIDLLHAFVVHEADYVHGVARRTTPR